MAGFQWKPDKNYHRGIAYVEVWHRLTVEALRALIVSDERRAWILETYPPDEGGRPGLFAPRNQRTGSKIDSRVPPLCPEPKPDEKVGWEYEGHEHELGPEAAEAA